ncbi:ER-based factor for assembly of V-ATPase [Trifolium repens]|nr:ER-based factor for assembly of V-ATPase [Trifolium repens]
MKLVPEKSWVNLGLVDGSEAIQIARSGSYGTSDWVSRSEDVCRSSRERAVSLEAPERKTRMESVLDITNPTRFELLSVLIFGFSVNKVMKTDTHHSYFHTHFFF